jgi:hypothetical protein
MPARYRLSSLAFYPLDNVLSLGMPPAEVHLSCSEEVDALSRLFQLGITAYGGASQANQPTINRKRHRMSDEVVEGRLDHGESKTRRTAAPTYIGREHLPERRSTHHTRHLQPQSIEVHKLDAKDTGGECDVRLSILDPPPDDLPTYSATVRGHGRSLAIPVLDCSPGEHNDTKMTSYLNGNLRNHPYLQEEQETCAEESPSDFPLSPMCPRRDGSASPVAYPPKSKRTSPVICFETLHRSDQAAFRWSTLSPVTRYRAVQIETEIDRDAPGCDGRPDHGEWSETSGSANNQCSCFATGSAISHARSCTCRNSSHGDLFHGRFNAINLEPNLQPR